MIKPKKKKTTREPKPREFPDNPVPRPEIDQTPLPHNKIRDLRGLTFAHLFVYGYSRTRQMANGHMDVYWNCWCDCGTLCEVTRRGLVVRKTQSCGCTTQVGRKGVLANQVTQLKRSEMTKRIKMGLPPVPPTIVDGDPAVAFAHDSLLSYACLQWDKYIPAAHHRLVAHYLERVERGEIKRLMITLPPRHGKSMILSEFFPAWYLGRNPDKRIIAASYGQELASDFGRKVRNQIADPLFQEIFPESKLADDSAAVDKFNLAHPKTGGYFAVGVGGALTGRGAHCFVAGTKISTNHGDICIEDLLCTPRPVKILSFDIKESKLEYQDIEGFSGRIGFGIYRITTSSGRVVEITGDHPVYVPGKGYTAANELSSGDPVVRLLQEGVCTNGVSTTKEHKPWVSGFLLLTRMFGVSSCREKQAALRVMWGACISQAKKTLRFLPREAGYKKDQTPTNRGYLSSLQYFVYSEVARKKIWEICAVLQKALFGNWSFNKNDWGREPALAAWSRSFEETTPFSEIIPDYAASCYQEGQQYLRSLWGKWNYVARSSFGWECNEQCFVESSNALPEVPFTDSCCDGFWAGYDKVESVVRVREEAAVYDIQVSKNHNLFASGLLCHNCLIIDDPIKSREDGDSESYRRRLKDWYTAVAYTRLMDQGAIIVCQTRWHESDLAGWLLTEHRHENWIHLDLPAINENNEPLWPEKFPLSALESIRRTLPQRDWLALYQQKPFADEGGIFKRHWWKMWPTGKDMPDCEYVIQSWDTAFSDRDIKTNSYSARTTWGVFKRADDDYANLILLEAWKGHVDYSDLRKEALRAYKEYTPDKVIIEKKASGQSLLQDMRRAGLPIVAWTPERDKITRAYAAQSLFENGRVYYPDRRWAEDVIAELAAFPQGTHSDTVDTVSQAFMWVQRSWLVRNSADVDADEDDLPDNVKRFKPRKAAYA